MPSKAPTPCRYAGCGKSHTNRNGYCDEHKSASSWKTNNGISSCKRGYDRKWRKLRELVLKRDWGMCQPCYKSGKIRIATEVDHIVSKSNGGSDDIDNLQSICTNCHKLKTRQERGAG